jgi:uroporphyrinogen-III synthase
MDTKTTLWSLRPAGEHAALRQAAQGAGFALRALSTQRLVMRYDRARLAAALSAPLRIYTSPAAVRFAAAQSAGGLHRDGVDIGVGSGTAAALLRAGVPHPRMPERMDSEGVLALPELSRLDNVAVGLITAPGGRGVLAPALAGRAAVLRIAEVYARSPLRGGARRCAAFVADAKAMLVVSSADAFAQLLARLPAPHQDGGRRLRNRPVIVSSERLAERARDAAFADVWVAEGPAPTALVAAASRVAFTMLGRQRAASP